MALPYVTTNQLDKELNILKTTLEKEIEQGGGGTIVEANPEGEATAQLTKLQVEDTIYSIPEGGGSSSDIFKQQKLKCLSEQWGFNEETEVVTPVAIYKHTVTQYSLDDSENRFVNNVFSFYVPSDLEFSEENVEAYTELFNGDGYLLDEVFTLALPSVNSNVHVFPLKFVFSGSGNRSLVCGYVAATGDSHGISGVEFGTPCTISLFNNDGTIIDSTELEDIVELAYQPE